MWHTRPRVGEQMTFMADVPAMLIRQGDTLRYLGNSRGRITSGLAANQIVILLATSPVDKLEAVRA